MLRKINEESISLLVDTFYDRVRKDEVLSDVFNTIISDWDSHLIKLKNFWNSVLLGTNTYSGNPYIKHMGLKTKSAEDDKVILESGHKIQSSITKDHFEVWLNLFRSTAQEILLKEEVEVIMQKANMIANSLQMGMFQKEHI